MIDYMMLWLKWKMSSSGLKRKNGEEMLVALQIERIKLTNRKVNLKISDFIL